MSASLTSESESGRAGSPAGARIASSRAWASAGAAAANPSVKRIESASSRTSTGRGSRAAGHVDGAGERAAQELEVGFACQLGRDGLKAARRAHEQGSRLLCAALSQRDLGAQELGARSLELVDLTRLDHRQEHQRG